MSQRIRCTFCNDYCVQRGIRKYNRYHENLWIQINGHSNYIELRVKTERCSFTPFINKEGDELFNLSINDVQHILNVCPKCGTVYFGNKKIYDPYPPISIVDTERVGVDRVTDSIHYIIKQGVTIKFVAPDGIKIHYSSFTNHQNQTKYNLRIGGKIGFLYTDFKSKVTWVERINNSNVLEMKLIE